MSQSQRYQVGEKVLCHHHGLLYEAKCLQVEIREGEIKYLVHYNGWNKNWDEWVDPKRMMKDDAEGHAKRDQLRNEAMKRARGRRGSRRSSQVKGKTAGKENSLTDDENEPLRLLPPAGDSPVPIGQDQSDLSQNEIHLFDWQDMEETEPVKPQQAECSVKDLSISLPAILRAQLADDHDYITVQLKLVAIPRQPSVCDILNAYTAQCPVSSRQKTATVMTGLSIVFEAALGPVLLYRLERWQYHQAREIRPPVPLASLYGAEHLLRLLTKVPSLLCSVACDSQQAHTIIGEVCGLVSYLSKNAANLFLQDYETPPLEYLRVALH